jgi:hypothetical protein
MLSPVMPGTCSSRLAETVDFIEDECLVPSLDTALTGSPWL